MINQLQGERPMLNSFTFQKIKTKKKLRSKVLRQDWKVARKLQRKGKGIMQEKGMVA